MSSHRRALVTPALALLLAALAGCAGGAAGAPPRAATEPAPAAVTPATAGTEAAADGTLTAADFVRTLTDAQLAAQSYEMTLALRSGPTFVSMNGAVHLTDPPAFDLEMLATDLPPMTLRSVDGVGYVGLGELTEDKFVRVDPDDPDDPLAAPFAEYLRQADPTADLAQQEAGIVEVTAAGAPFELDGVEVRAYDVVVDPSRVPEKLAQIEAALPAGDEVPETITYRFVVDAEGLTRQMSFDVLGVRLDASFTSWGSAPPVEVPSADELTSRSPFPG